MANEPEGHKRRLINTIIIITIRQEKVKGELLVSEEEEHKGAGGRKEQN